jgi:hypothetical protein
MLQRPSEKGRGNKKAKEAFLVGFCIGLALGIMLFELIMRIAVGW